MSVGSWSAPRLQGGPRTASGGRTHTVPVATLSLQAATGLTPGELTVTADFAALRLCRPVRLTCRNPLAPNDEHKATVINLLFIVNQATGSCTYG